jgi:MFS family permease
MYRIWQKGFLHKMIKKSKMGVWIWTSVVIFYLYQYIIRVSPGVMADNVMDHFKIDANTFGLLSAITTYTYAALQIPAGVLSDLFGTRRMVLWSIALCVSGLFLFCYTDHLSLAYLARFMIGAGSACAFLCVSKASSDWFSPDKKVFLFSLTVTAGTIGALLGGKPLTYLSNTYGWQSSLLVLSIVGLAIFIMNMGLLKDTPQAEASLHATTTLKSDILAVFK